VYAALADHSTFAATRGSRCYGCETELLSCVSVFGDEDSPSTDQQDHAPALSSAFLANSAARSPMFQSRAAPGNASVFSSGLLFMVADDFR